MLAAAAGDPSGAITQLGVSGAIVVILLVIGARMWTLLQTLLSQSREDQKAIYTALQASSDALRAATAVTQDQIRLTAQLLDRLKGSQ